MDASDLQETRIVKVGVLSVANTLGIINVFMGFIFGLFLWLVMMAVSSLVSSVISPGVGTGNSFSGLGAFFYLIIFPLLFGALGWISGLISAWFYNMSSKISKGIKLYSN